MAGTAGGFRYGYFRIFHRYGRRKAQTVSALSLIHIFIAVAIMVAGAVFDIVGKFLAYYGFTVYRDGRDLHVKRGLIRLQSLSLIHI